MRSSILVLVTSLVFAACDASVCTRNSDCTSGLVCGEEATCVVPPDLAEVDGGSDLSVADEGVALDLGVPDLADGASTDANTD